MFLSSSLRPYRNLFATIPPSGGLILLSFVNLPLSGMSWVPICSLPLDSGEMRGRRTAVIVGVVGGFWQIPNGGNVGETSVGTMWP